MLQQDDLQALGLFGQAQPDPYGFGSVDQLLGVQPLSSDPGPSPQLPSAPSQDKLAGNEENLNHLAAAMKAAVSAPPDAPKGLVKAGETVRYTDDGQTPAQRAAAVLEQGQLAQAEGQIAVDRQSKIAEAYDAQVAKGRADADLADEQRAKAEADNEARQTRIRDSQQRWVDQVSDPIDPSKTFENMSLFSKAAALLSAFSYGYLNPRGQGTAPIVTTLMQMASEDTRAQMANAAEGRARRGDMIDHYDRMYGDTTAVAKKLEADKLLTLSKRAMLDAKDSKSAEARAASEDMAKSLRVQAEAANSAADRVLNSKPVSERTTTYRPAGGAGKAVDPVERAKKVAEAAKALEAAGASKEAIADLFKKAGFEAPSRKTAAELTNEEQANKKEKPTEAEAKKQSAVSALTNLRKQMTELPEKIHNRESESLATRGARGAADVLFGKGAGDATLSDREKKDAQTFKQARTNYTALLSVALQQGALAGPEYDRAVEAAGAFERPRQMRDAIDNVLEMLGSAPDKAKDREASGFKRVK